jgi:hypothetical protein
MKHCFLALAMSVMVALALTTAAMAGTIDTITFKNATGVAYGNVYVGIYQGTIYNGLTTTITDFICDDFDHEIGSGDFWKAYVGSTSPVSSTVRFGPGDTTDPDLQNLTRQEDYNMVAYLAEQIFADPNDTSGNWGNLAWAIWSINSSEAYQSSYDTPLVQVFLTDAFNARDTNNGNLIVYTPTGQLGQEFLAQDPNPTPEPASMVLFGTALALALAWLGGKKLLS